MYQGGNVAVRIPRQLREVCGRPKFSLYRMFHLRGGRNRCAEYLLEAIRVRHGVYEICVFADIAFPIFPFRPLLAIPPALSKISLRGVAIRANLKLSPPSPFVDETSCILDTASTRSPFGGIAKTRYAMYQVGESQYDLAKLRHFIRTSRFLPYYIGLEYSEQLNPKR